MTETWRPIPSLTEYLASSEGRLMRIPHLVRMPNGGTAARGGIPILGQWDGTRYILRYRKRTMKVHRLICEAFHGLSPFDGAVVMHLNEDASVNRASNLAWGTQQENMNAPGFLSYCSTRIGKDNPLVKGVRRAVIRELEETHGISLGLF
jgi:hypothetical protein